MAIEFPPPPKKPERIVDPHEQRRNFHFTAILGAHLDQTMRDALEEAHFARTDIDQISRALAELPEGELQSTLAIPFEIRARLLSRYHEQLAAGKLNAVQMVEDLRKKMSRYAIGLHYSKTRVPKVTKGGHEEWNVHPTELDDRDDMKMAYYSLDYLSRYKNKADTKYLYLVRADIGPETSHKRDLQNNWGRAPYLSIIDELDVASIEREIDEQIKKEQAASISEAA